VEEAQEQNTFHPNATHCAHTVSAQAWTKSAEEFVTRWLITEENYE
jgi:hypothetical protein